MPNPSGANQFAKQPAYGDVKKLQNLTKSAPLAGTSPSLGAPKRAQRRAVKRGGAPAPATQATPALTAPAPDSRAVVREVFNELLRMQPDDPLFQYYAQKANES